MKKIILLLINICFFTLQSAYAMTIDRLIVFGDSLSDNGNLYALTASLHKYIPLVPILPIEPYFKGRFSNGPIWVEQLATMLNIPIDDYAYGGAWVEPYYDSMQVIPYNLGTQIDFYVAQTISDNNRAKHLYVIWAGGNDYSKGRANEEYATTNTISYLQSQIEWLIYYGAKQFLLFNIPDLSIVPQVVAKGPEFAASIKRLSQLHDSKFADMILKLQHQYPDVKFIQMDVRNHYEDIIKNPDKYHLKNVSESCYNGDYSFLALQQDVVQAVNEAKINLFNNPTLSVAYLTSMSREKPHCINPDEYLFWDSIHPTRVVHQLIATATLEKIEQSD